MKVLVTGDSHVTTLKRGRKLMRVEQEGKTHQGFELLMRPLGPGNLTRSKFFKDCGDYAEITDPVYRERFTRLPPENGAYSLIGLSLPFRSNALWSNDWQGFSAFGMQPETGWVMSQPMLDRIIADKIEQALGFIDVIRKTVPVFVIEATAPFRHNAAVARTGEALVGFLHRAYRSYLMEKLRERDVHVVEIDPVCVDADGFMAQRFRNESESDYLHGSAEFGLLMMRRVMEHVSSVADHQKNKQIMDASVASRPATADS